MFSGVAHGGVQSYRRLPHETIQTFSDRNGVPVCSAMTCSLFPVRFHTDVGMRQRLSLPLPRAAFQTLGRSGTWRLWLRRSHTNFPPNEHDSSQKWVRPEWRRTWPFLAVEREEGCFLTWGKLRRECVILSPHFYRCKPFWFVQALYLLPNQELKPWWVGSQGVMPWR